MRGYIGFILITLTMGFLSAHAKEYPDRQVGITVPFPAGGSTDILARHLGHGLSKLWNVPVTIENKAGVSGIIGTRDIVQSKNDGYKLLFIGTHHVINPSLYQSLPFDPVKEMTSIALIATVPNVLIVNNEFPAKTVAELIKMAREKPGSIDYASSGTGGSNHLGGELFKMLANVDMNHISYKGESPAIQDVMGGHVPVMFAALTTVIPANQSGKIRPLAVAVKEHVSQLPGVPTLDESGVKGYESMAWFGLYGPADLPETVVQKLRSDVMKVLSTPELQEALEKNGAYAASINQVDFPEFVNGEITKWGQVMDQAKVPKLSLQ